MPRAEALRLRRRAGLIARDLGTSVVVMDPQQQTAHTLRAGAAELWRATNAPDGAPAGSPTATAALVEKDLVVAVGLTRRAMLSRIATIGVLAGGATLIESVALPLAAAHASTTRTYILGTSMAQYIAAHPASDSGWANPTSPGGFAFLFYVLSSLTVGQNSITQGAYTGLNRFDSKAATQPSASYSGTWSVGTPGGTTVAAPYLGYAPTLFGTPTAVAVTTATTGLGIEFITQTANPSGQYALSFTVAANAAVSIYVCNATTGALAAQHNFATGALSYSVTIPTSLTPGSPALGIVIFPNDGASKGSTVAVVQVVTD